MNTFNDILKQDLPYLDSTRNKILLIGFLVFFVFIFLSVYAPFNMNQWGKENYLGYISIGCVVLLLTQFVLRPLFGFKKIRLSSLILWCIIEVLLITFGIYLAYSPSLETLSEKINEFFITARYVVLISIGPYLLFIWYLSLNYRFSTFKKIAPSNQAFTKTENELLTITGDNKKVILAIDYNQLLFIKSSGNYLDIHYLKGETPSKEIVRMSLKELEVKITDSSFVRIHRSYMVNKDRISSFKKTKKGYKINMQHIAKEIIPVSLGYKDKFEEALEIKLPH